MYFDYNDFFPQPQMTYASSNTYIVIAAAIGVVLALIFSFTLFRKSNENKLKGKSRVLYNFMNLNKFYTEDIVRILNIITFFVATAVGLALIFKGKWEEGLLVLIGVNVLARIVYELIMMYVIQVRKTLAIEKKVDKIEKFYQDDFDDYDDGACSSCENCEQSSCEGCASFTTQENFTSVKPTQEAENNYDRDNDKPADPPHVITL